MEQKKKLLVTASTFPRWEGDTEPRFVLDLSKHMTDEFDVTVLVPAAPGARNLEILEGVKVIRYHYFPVHKWETLCYPGAIVPRIKEKKVRIFLVPFLMASLYIHLFRILPDYDIVHAHWLIPQGIVQSFFKKPYIVTGHGGDISSLNKGIFRVLKTKCLNNAGAVAVVSKYKQEELEREFHFVKSQILSMGVDTTLFSREENFVENYWGQGQERIVLYIGRLAEIKGVNYLINAMNYVENAKLVIVGEGPEKQNLINIAKKFGNKVIFSGSKNHEELKAIYASGDVLVVPSIIDSKGAQEGLPTVIMEAFASKLPVIATKTGGIPDIIKNGINGVLVEEKSSDAIAEAINKIFKEKDFTNGLIEEGYKVAKENDYGVVAYKYCELIERILKR